MAKVRRSDDESTFPTVQARVRECTTQVLIPPMCPQTTFHRRTLGTMSICVLVFALWIVSRAANCADATNLCYFNWVQNLTVSHSGSAGDYDVLVQIPASDGVYIARDFQLSLADVRFRYPHTNYSLGWLNFWVESTGENTGNRMHRIWLTDVPLDPAVSNSVEMYWRCQTTDGSIQSDVSTLDPSGVVYGTRLTFTDSFYLPVASDMCAAPWTPYAPGETNGRFIQIRTSGTGTTFDGFFENHGHSFYSAGGSTSPGQEMVECEMPSGNPVTLSLTDHWHMAVNSPDILNASLPETRPPHIEVGFCHCDRFELHSQLIIPLAGPGNVAAGVASLTSVDVANDNGAFLLVKDTLPTYTGTVLGSLGHSHFVKGLGEASSESSGDCEGGEGVKASIPGHRHLVNDSIPLDPPISEPEINLPPYVEVQFASPTGTLEFHPRMMVFTDGPPPAGLQQIVPSIDGAFLRGSSAPTSDPTSATAALDHRHSADLLYNITDDAGVADAVSAMGFTVSGQHTHELMGADTEAPALYGSHEIDRVEFQLWGYPQGSDLKQGSIVDLPGAFVPREFCSSVFLKNPAVCSGRGDCIDELCECHEDRWGGTTCNVPACYGRLITDADVCGPAHLSVSKGTCVNGTCECTNEAEWRGDQCDEPVCGGEVDPVACGGANGVCQSPGTCQCSGNFALPSCTSCKAGFAGTDCSPKTGLSIEAIGGIAGGAVAAVLVVVLLLFLLVVVICCFLRKKPAGVRGVGLGLTDQGVGLDDLDRLEATEAEEAVAKLEIDRSLFEISYDDLKVEKSIGKGGSSATVFRATWQHQKVAFKVFQLQDFLDQEKFTEFEKEVKFLASLGHPNILRFYGATLSPPRVGIVMELCEHGDCDEYLKTHPETPLSVRLEWLRGISSAMAFIHSKNVIHRDLKPGNVLLATKKLIPKLMDFGLSRVMESRSQAKTVRIGTTFYMAPELTLGGGTYGTEVDVFSFGVMIFTIVTGEMAPYGVSSANIEIRVANDPDCRPSFDDHQVPEDVMQLAKESWADEPSDRPTFDQIVVRLRKMVDKTTEEVGSDADGDGVQEVAEGKKESESSDSSEDSSSSSSSSDD